MNTSTTHQTILVIDPDPSVRALIVALLRREGYAAAAAHTSDAALEIHRSMRPAAVILEPRMAGGDALLHALQNEKMIVVTTPDDPAEAFVAGSRFHTVLFKPFVLDELAVAIASCCQEN